jgi:HlyD family secretion protein
MQQDLNNVENSKRVVIDNNPLRSEPMQEILSRQPSFMAKWALLFFASILLLLFAGTWFIHYPEIVTTSATLTGTNAPKEIIPLQDGKLVRLFANNNAVVEKGAVIGWIESNANHLEVLSLSKKVDEAVILLQNNNPDKIQQLFIEKYTSLGELQTVYQPFVIAYQTFIDYLNNGYYPQKQKVLQADITFLEQTKLNLLTQKKLLLQDLQLTEDGYKANEGLYKDKVISKQDYRNEQSKLITKQLTIPQIEAGLLTNETQVSEKQKEINDLSHSISQQQLIFKQALQNLQSQIEDWKKRFLIQAPIAGKVQFSIPIQENQFLKSSKALGFVNPDSSAFYAETMLPQNNFGKIAVGQQVQLRLSAYPFNEFGFVRGRLQYISNIATDSGFLAKILLPEGLVTSQRKVLHYNSGLKAEALIITKDRNLLESFYANIIKGVNQ